MFIPVILILPSLIGFNGVIYSQAIADLLTTILTVIFAIGLVKTLKNMQDEKIDLGENLINESLL